MIGDPKWFNTRTDVENWRNMAGEEAYKATIQRFYNARMEWETTSILEDGATGVIDDTHRIIENVDMETQELIRYQQELQVNPDAYIFTRLKYTDSECRNILGLE